MRFRRAVAVLAVAGVLPLMLVSAPTAAAASPRPACTITGTAGDDHLRGTSGDDVICGLGGDDVIVGGGGDDLLLGGPGDDDLSGGPGNDVIVGGKGDDSMWGGRGDDLLLGQTGDDDYVGGAGEDTLLNTMAKVKDYTYRTVIATSTSEGPVTFTLDSSSECVTKAADPPALNTAQPAELFVIDAEPWCIWGASVRYTLTQKSGGRMYRGGITVQVRLNPDYSLLTMNAACSGQFRCGFYGDDLSIPKITVNH